MTKRATGIREERFGGGERISRDPRVENDWLPPTSMPPASTGVKPSQPVPAPATPSQAPVATQARLEGALRQQDNLMRSLRPTESEAKPLMRADTQTDVPVTGVRAKIESRASLASQPARQSHGSGRARVNSPAPEALLLLASEFEAVGTGLRRWCGARLRDAHTEESSGNLLGSVHLIRMVCDRLSDRRVQKELDRVSRALREETAETARTLARQSATRK